MRTTSHETQDPSLERSIRSGHVLAVRRGSDAAGLAKHTRAALVRRGDAVRVGRGVYQATSRRDTVGIHPYKAIAGIMGDRPYFISWWSALSFHGLTEYHPFEIAVAVQTQRRTQQLAGSEVRFIRLQREKFIGLQTVDMDGVRVRIATPERATLDVIDRPDLGGGLSEAVKAISSGRLDIDKLVRLAARFPSHATIRRVGYLLTILGVGDARPLLGRRGRSGYTPLDAGLGNAGAVDSTWSVIDNVGPDAIRRWAERRS